MSNSSDPAFDRCADTDFTNAKPVTQVPALAKLQAAHGGNCPAPPDEAPIWTAEDFDKSVRRVGLKRK